MVQRFPVQILTCADITRRIGLMHTVPGTGTNVHDVTQTASVRAKVEHPFRVIKRQFCRVKARHRGPAKDTAQLMTLFALSNLWMARDRQPFRDAAIFYRDKEINPPPADFAPHIRSALY